MRKPYPLLKPFSTTRRTKLCPGLNESFREHVLYGSTEHLLAPSSIAATSTLVSRRHQRHVYYTTYIRRHNYNNMTCGNFSLPPSPEH